MMEWKPTRIGVRGRGPSIADGVVGECGQCGCRQWVLFGLGSGRAPHAQCTSCQAVYCMHPEECEAFDTYAPADADAEDTVHPFAEGEGGGG